MWMQTMKSYLESHPCQYGNSTVTSMIEFLWDNYTYHNPLDSAQIRTQLQRLDVLSGKLSWNEQNMLMDTISKLCLAYEREAFTEGIFVGAKLVTELLEMEKTE